MINCRPYSFFSRSYTLTGLRKRATLDFEFIREQGTMVIDDVFYEILKTKITSGEWEVTEDGVPFAKAKKVSAFRRSFDIQAPMGELRLHAEGLFTFNFFLEHHGELVASITRKNIFSRKATIQLFNDQVEFATAAFAFWLSIVIGRRGKRSS